MTRPRPRPTIPLMSRVVTVYIPVDTPDDRAQELYNLLAPHLELALHNAVISMLEDQRANRPHMTCTVRA